MLPKYLALGSLLNVQATTANIAAAKAVFPEINLPFSNFKGTIAQALKPFPQYSGTSYYSGNLGNSHFNSLQLTLDRRFANGFTMQVGYTFSKEIDNVIGVATNLGSAGGNRDPYNGSLDKALGAIDHPHVFHATFLYQLPFGAGHNLGSGNAIVRALVSHWQASGIITFTSGAPLGITGSGCNTPGVVSSTNGSAAYCDVSYNPNFTGPVRINGSYGDGNAIGTGAVSYLNKAAFIDPAPYTFGNLPRSAAFGLFGPSLLDEDVSLRREFPIRESIRLAVQADAFNVTNSVQFAAPATNIDSANFGQVTTTNNLPRKIQFSARLTF